MTTFAKMEIDKLVKFVKPVSEICGLRSKPFTELPYGVVAIDIPSLQAAGSDPQEIIETVMLCQHSEFDYSSADYGETVSFLLWIKEQMEKIRQIEEIGLASDPEPEMMAAGIHLLNQFYGWNTVRKLAAEFGKDPDEVREWPYHKIYLLQKMDTVRSVIDKRYNEIIKNKKPS